MSTGEQQAAQTGLTVTGVRRVHSRAVLTLSNGETRTMPRALLRERPYRVGVPFDEAAFDALLQDRAYPFALERAVSLLAVRARTECELRDALRQCAYSEATIERVIARMDEAGYIDDADFAGQWAASRTGKGLGARRIAMELRRKGVDAEIIEQAIGQIDEEERADSVLRAAQKAARGKDLASPADRQKVFAALMRRGYGAADARQAISSLLSEQNDE